MNTSHQPTEPDSHNQPTARSEARLGTDKVTTTAQDDTNLNCLDLLDSATQALNGAPGPDSAPVREALRAARQVTGAAGAVSASMPGWHFALLELSTAETELRDGLPALAPARNVARPSDASQACAGTLNLVRRLAELYRSAAFNASLPGFRRLVWAAVAGNLDNAAAHLEAAS
jgi:hypothetical protein